MTKYTLIFQKEKLPSVEWIIERMRDYTERVVFDGKRELVVDNAIVVDEFIYARDPAYYQRFRGKNAFLIHWYDEFLELGLDVYKNFRGVFRPHWTGSFDPKYMMFFPDGYTNGTARPAGSELTPASRREYVWSFTGEIGKTSRPEMVRALNSVIPNYLFGTDTLGGFTIYNRPDGQKRRLSRERCAEILRQSIFAPSPMGNVNQECYRTYEALEAGSIPIVEKRLTLDYHRMAFGPHPLPTVSSWAQAQRLIRDLLQSASRLDALQKECMDWWADYKLRLDADIGHFLARREADPEPMGEPAHLWAPQRIWQIGELLRRQTPSTLARRVLLNSSRLLTTGKLRVSYSPKNRVKD